ncbi:MAG: UvrD-helicase domain-containing protein [Paludibacteraceae bacterium]|nr:UvrD-helicase domain-containing protein [Paludibacteraceae bacterium]
MPNQRLINTSQPITICSASAGTGKTYTLAAYYVGLLLSGEDYRSILAITFTNKATAEMSERIIGYLHSISKGEETHFLARARQFMIRDEQAPDSELARRAGECFRKMLLDYDNVQVMTIDSFLQTLLSGLASVLHRSAGLTTELDVEHVIEQAEDRLLTTDMTVEDKSIIEDYMRLKLDQESQWDVRQSLCALAKELYNESVQVLDADHKILFNADVIAKRRAVLEDLWASNETVAELKTLLAQCDPTDYNRYTKCAYDRLTRSVANPQKIATADRFRGVSEKNCNAEPMARATELAARAGRLYNTIQLTIRFSRDMQLMASLQALIQSSLAEANCALLAQTASTLSRALKGGDADFILEKAGIRYKHILIDEFQDTSMLQWSVIEQLVADVLAGVGHTLLIVGDIKQSIYRWRNGDWHIMNSLLDEPRRNKTFTSLTKNYRSSEEVVRFNLSLFKHIIETYKAETDEQQLIERIYGEGYSPDEIEQFYQSDKKKGGYVRFQAFPKGTKEDLAMNMFDAMEDLLAQGALAKQMMILVREKREAVFITDLHATLDADQYPHLANEHIVSADSFLLEASEAVRTIIAGLRMVVKDDEVAAKYIEMVTGNADFIPQIRARITSRTPLYEAICELIRLLIADADGQYHGKETAYINNLLDRTRAYVGAYGSHIDDFLVYWDDTMHAKPIPASSSDAIRILTVHASKGLQAQTLFVPFCMWTKEAGRHPQKIWCEIADEISEDKDFVPIQDGSEMADSAYAQAYEMEHRNMRIDNLNMLYVALTRTEDNLYISTSYPVTSKGVMGVCNHVGRYIMDYVGADEYEAGKPVIKPAEEETKTETQWAELWANSEQVRFVQSQEGALYTDYGDEAYRRVARMEEGTLCHEIFANLRKADELEQVLDDFESRGEIASAEQREVLKSLISSAWKGNEQMRDWFTAPWQLKLEEAIYIDHRELRPDRVMINPETNEAIVLDYKFGVWEDKYITQVREYMEALRRMGHTPVRGYLWFARTNKLVPVTPN